MTPEQEAFFAWDPAQDPEFAPLIIGEGSIGGKGRTLLFGIRKLRDSDSDLLRSVVLPRSRYIGVRVFEEFLQAVPHLPALIEHNDPAAIEQAFLAAPLPSYVTSAIGNYLAEVRDPVIVRSSSLLEDSLKYSFAGKYLSTFLLNNQDSLEERVAAVAEQIKRIYARIYFPAGESYRAKHGLGGDEMGIAIMRIAGKWRGKYYYPTTAGVGFSYNGRRWTTRVKREDGLLRLVFGLGTMSTKRGYARTYSLTNPHLRPEGSNAYKVMKHSQEHFNAIDKDTGELATVDIKDIWHDAMRWHPDLGIYACLYYYDDEQGYFSPIDKSSSFQVGEAKICMPFENFPRTYAVFFKRMKLLLPLLAESMGTPADIEFAYEPLEDRLELLQSRPLWVCEDKHAGVCPPLTDCHVILQADRMVTDGNRDSIRHIVYVDHQIYSTSSEFSSIARAVGYANQSLAPNKYILVAPGRVGSSSPELGVPVRYDELTNAACIVEVGIPRTGQMPELSYGTHFFSDLETDDVLYMPVFQGESGNIFDQDWFDNTPYDLGAHNAIRIYSGDFSIFMNGDQNLGVIFSHNPTA